MEEVTRGLLDTSVIIAHTEEDLGTSLPTETAISVATLAELHFGVLITSDPEIRSQRVQRLGLVEAMFDPLPLDAGVGRAFATVAHAVKTAGGQPAPGSWTSGSPPRPSLTGFPSTREISRTSSCFES